MTRPTSDLLDFFGRKSGGAGGGARAVSKPLPGDRPSMSVSRRQASIGVVGAGLLVALAFAGGYLLGKSKRSEPAGPGLTRQAVPEPETWILRGRVLPKIGVGTEPLATKAVAAIKNKYSGLARFVDWVPVETGNGRVSSSNFRLIVRGFKTEDDGLGWAKTLSNEQVDSYFLFKDCRPERASR
jgi:hypothetical protein